jgi:hypothetical protein
MDNSIDSMVVARHKKYSHKMTSIDMYERGKQDAIHFGYIPDFRTETEKAAWIAGYREQKAKQQRIV